MSAARYPEGVPGKVAVILKHELRLIETLKYAPYFLTVNAIVRFARGQDILCQGRGSAANSAVCYVLGITSIDPERNDLLFERFVSEERREPPEIDADLEHERREIVMQWVFETYGRNHAALCSTVIRYRAKGALRDVGKALGLPEDLTKMLSSQVWGWPEEGVESKHAEDLNLNPGDRRLRLALDLARQLIGAPRHLSQHPGGFVLTHDRLDELVPIEPAPMKDRQVIEWDKDDIDALKFMKVDCLALGMLTCMKRGLDLLAEHKGIELDLATIPAEDPKTYAMIRKADTLGVFLREGLRRQLIVTCVSAMQACDGRWLQTAGLVLVRQMPGSAKGVMFITIEDETGIANLVIWPKVFEKQRRVILSARMMAVNGRIRREGEVVHLVAHRLTDLSSALASVGDRDVNSPLPHGRGDEVRHGSPGVDPRSLPPKWPGSSRYRHSRSAHRLDQDEDGGFPVGCANCRRISDERRKAQDVFRLVTVGGSVPSQISRGQLQALHTVAHVG